MTDLPPNLRPNRPPPPHAPLSRRTLGILGSCAPAVTAHIHGLIVRLAQLHFGAEENHDFPEIIALSRPVIGMTALGFKDDDRLQVQADLQTARQRFLTLGAQVILPTCNSVAGLLADPDVISLPDVAAQAAKNRDARRVGVLGSRRSKEDALHQRALETREIEIVEVHDHTQQRIDALIQSVMGGRQGIVEQMTLSSLCAELLSRGADTVIMGCTELSMIGLDDPSGVVDAAAVSALEALLRLSRLEPAPAL